MAGLKMLRFSLGVTTMDKIRNEYNRGAAQVGRFGAKTREARLTWFGHVRRKDKALNGLAPEYITDLLQAYVPTRSLRSAGAHLLLEPKTTTRWGARAFSKTTPVLWNTLPSAIKATCSLASFKIGLKTYLFKAAFL